MNSLRLLLAATLLALAAPAAWSEAALRSCRVPGVSSDLQCGSVMRPLDPARPEGVKIEIHYAVAPATARRRQPDPVFMLAGGPGLSAIESAAGVLPLMARVNERRDIVFVDQRGTGRSAPLVCDDGAVRTLAAQADVEGQIAQAAACRERLGKLPYGDLRFFTTLQATQDLDAVRAQLGAAQIDLVGVSYGTRVALDYLRQFPAAVRRAVIDGVVSPETMLPLSFSTDGQRALDALLAACDNEADCSRLHPELRAHWAALLAGLPREITAAHPLTGQSERFVATRDMVLIAVRGALYAPTLAAALPLAIDEAARGRFEPLLGLDSLGSPRKGQAPAMGMHYSAICSEDYPRFGQSTDAPGADFGRSFESFYERVCADWPRNPVPAAFYALPHSPVPVLALSGALDPATPPRHAERVVKALGPNARHVVVPNAGHGVMPVGCMRDVVFLFLDARDARSALAVDAACAQGIPRPPAFRSYVLENPP